MPVVGEPIVWKLSLPASRSRVFRALADPIERAHYWAHSPEGPAGIIQFHFSSGEQSKGRVLRKREPELFELEYFGATATFELCADEPSITDLMLTHTGVRREEWLETYAGWLNVLLPLKAWIVCGIDIRNGDPRKTWTDGYVDQ